MAIDSAGSVSASIGPTPIASIGPVSWRSTGQGAAEGPMTPPLLGSNKTDGDPAGVPANASAGSAGGGASSPSREQMHAAIESANQQLAQDGRNFRFQFDDQVHQTIVKIVDSRTNQVLDQIPSDAMLAAARALASGSTSGVLLQTKV